MKEVKLLGIRPRQMLCRIKGLSGNYAVYMQPITAKDEKELDETERLSLQVDASTVVDINREIVYCYGEVDINNEEDILGIRKFNLVNNDGNTIHSNFDYETGVAYYEGSTPKFYTTTDPVLNWKYAYTLIGKPERVIVYKVKIY